MDQENNLSGSDLATRGFPQVQFWVGGFFINYFAFFFIENQSEKCLNIEKCLFSLWSRQGYK
jgi:hypothetical protein